MSNEDIIEDVRTGEDLLIFNLGYQWTHLTYMGMC